jgi:hypothetical protein
MDLFTESQEKLKLVVKFYNQIFTMFNVPIIISLTLMFRMG